MLATVDYLVIVVYLSFVLFIGWKSSKGNNTSEDYFMAGRSLAWFPIAMSVAATTISANGFLGGPGWAYTDGLSPYMIQAAIPLAIFFVVYTTLPVCYSLKLTSIYEYIELRLGPRTRLLTVLGFFANAIIQIGSMVFIPSLVISFFTGWSMLAVVPLVVLTAIAYTLLGGMKAVIWTDVCQMGIMWFSLAFIVVVIFKNTPLSISEMLNKAQGAEKFAALDFSFAFSSSSTFWASLLGGFVMWVNYFGFNQVQIQRVLTAKSVDDAKRSLVNSAVVMNVMYFVFMFIGIMLFVFYNGRRFDNANAIMLDFISNHLGRGLAGLVVAGIFAAAMSSVDSLFNSMTTVFTKDIYEKYVARQSGPASLRTSMAISFGFGILVTAVALLGFSKSAESVLNIVGNYISYISGPMAAVYFLSFFTVTANDKGVAYGAVLGFLSVVIFCSFVAVGWIWKPAIGLAFSLFFSLAFSSIFKDTDNGGREKYTLWSMLESRKNANTTIECGNSIAPFVFDRYCAASLFFFFSQYAVLFFLNR